MLSGVKHPVSLILISPVFPLQISPGLNFMVLESVILPARQSLQPETSTETDSRTYSSTDLWEIRLGAPMPADVMQFTEAKPCRGRFSSRLRPGMCRACQRTRFPVCLSGLISRADQTSARKTLRNTHAA